MQVPWQIELPNCRYQARERSPGQKGHCSSNRVATASPLVDRAGREVRTKKYASVVAGVVAVILVTLAQILSDLGSSFSIASDSAEK